MPKTALITGTTGQQMVAEDLQTARRYALLKAHGHAIPMAREDGR